MILKTFDLTKSYPSGAGVQNIDLTVERGSLVILSGPNGAGKSTLIKLLALVESMDSGHILMGDLNSSTLKVSDQYLWRRQLGVIPQDLMLMPERTVMQNVTLGLRAYGMTRNKAKKLALKMLSRVGLSHKIRQRVRHLSGGEARRTAIAKALCNEPFLLLADEPLGDLDPDTAEEIMNLFERINAMGTAIVMVTHRQDIRPQGRFKEIKMFNGRLV
ncbi:MAG: ATP-binding cassette domain-containing protein [FCB group bacterium]|nr:ATP-binding cassette domain-containing protein [FCB group bacterium]